MNNNLEKKSLYHESPHILIRKSLYLIRENSIFLKNATVSEDNTMLRKIHYDIEKVGTNVKMHSKNIKYRNIKMDKIPGKKLFILVNLKTVKDVHNLIFFDELGTRIEKSEIEKLEKTYVLLAVIGRKDIDKNKEILIDTSDVQLANKLWVNQIKTDKSFHFDTTSKIFGLGFGPKYCIDDTKNLSIGQSAPKKKLQMS